MKLLFILKRLNLNAVEDVTTHCKTPKSRTQPVRLGMDGLREYKETTSKTLDVLFIYYFYTDYQTNPTSV
jgi:hypothetical protein